MSESIAIRPGEKREFVLPSQETLPKEQQAVFYLGSVDYKTREQFMKFSMGSRRIMQKIEDLFPPGEYAQKEDENLEDMKARRNVLVAALPREKREQFDLLNEEFIRQHLKPEFLEATLGTLGNPTGLLGWKNRKRGGVEIKFDPFDFLNQLDDEEMVQLSMEIYSSQYLNRDQRKK